MQDVNLRTGNKLAKRFDFKHRNKKYYVLLTEDGILQLFLNDCLRKSRIKSVREPQYVWTNVELEWEEHHYIEVFYWSSHSQLKVTINGVSVFDEVV